MPVRLLIWIRWIALIVLVLAIALIVIRMKVPMPEVRSRGLIGDLRALWRRLREKRQDARDRDADLGALAGRSALLVDPDEKSARVMAWKLESLDCRVTKVRSGLQAIERARDGNYDVAIVDALLPDMSAQDFHQSLGKRDMPVVFVGVAASQYDELKSLGGSVACLSKPYDPEEAAALAGYLLPGSGDDSGHDLT